MAFHFCIFINGFAGPSLIGLLTSTGNKGPEHWEFFFPAQHGWEPPESIWALFLGEVITSNSKSGRFTASLGYAPACKSFEFTKIILLVSHKTE